MYFNWDFILFDPVKHAVNEVLLCNPFGLCVAVHLVSGTRIHTLASFYCCCCCTRKVKKKIEGQENVINGLSGSCPTH